MCAPTGSGFGARHLLGKVAGGGDTVSRMAGEPTFASVGKPTDSIEVRLSYRIVELFSEGLYSSPNKAVEELVANSFDAGAQSVHVLLSPNLHKQDATMAVIDDGEGMDGDALTRLALF